MLRIKILEVIESPVFHLEEGIFLRKIGLAGPSLANDHIKKHFWWMIFQKASSKLTKINQIRNKLK